jgi:hypothetical protein
MQQLTVYKKHLKMKDTSKLKVIGWKKIYQVHRNQKQVGIVILMSDKEDFTQKISQKW